MLPITWSGSIARRWRRGDGSCVLFTSARKLDAGGFTGDQDEDDRPAGYVDLGGVEFKDLSTVAQYVMNERMQLYNQRIRILRIL